MWYLACCNNEGKCCGFLTKDKGVLTEDVDNRMDELMAFKTKKDTTEICMQINLSHMLMPNGYSFRVTPVKG